MSGAGDRRDQDLIQLGELAARMFDEFIIKQDKSLRGRQSGETPELLKQGALRGGMREEQMSLVLPELEAVDTALRRAQPDDLVVVFADQVTQVWKRIIYFNKSDAAPAPVDA
jgi:cyanophycin synthetase